MWWFGSGRSTPLTDVIGCKFVHPVTSIRGVDFVYIHILLRFLWGGFGIEEKTDRRNNVIECKFVHIYIYILPHI